MVTTPMLTLFQFHTGSIKSNATIHACIRSVCFNSTLVRLKGQHAHQAEGGVLRFNSTLVRLKAK